jgi:integrase
MIEEVREAFRMEKEYQEFNQLKCEVTVDGYTDFIFINRFGNVQHQGTLNKALRRIIRDCNEYQLEKGGKNPVLLPKFSCHSLRHTFTTRLVEADVNIKVVQNVLGHADFKTTMDIYTDVTKELKQREFDDLEKKLKQQKL